ncbi:caspase family protein [Spirosoma sp. SC4-14]|uniref:caspase family protein n=1 Tax=Spirosoma sp. SC4-14 TaxID=3128900 RepID=UPI0030D0BC04
MLINTLICLGILGSWPFYEPPGNTYAVVVGIADYQALTYRTGDLRYADKDARQMVSYFRSKAGGNVPANHIRLLTNQQATYQQIREALSLFKQAKPGDRVIFYFSGHGLPESFVPYDVRPGNRQKLLSYQAIKSAFRDSKATTKLCIADACLAGGLTKQQRQKTAQITANEDNNHYVAMLLASRSTQYAVEDQRLQGGAFTYYLLKGLMGQADLDGNQIVTIRELHQYIAPRVKQATRSRQTPVFYGKFPDKLALSYL